VKHAITTFNIGMAVFSLIMNEMLEGEQVGFNSRRLNRSEFGFRTAGGKHPEVIRRLSL
jgi:hypothetical protein